MTAATLERAVGAVRTATAGVAVALGLFLLLRVSLIDSFRIALVVLAALETLSVGRRALSSGSAWPLWLGLAVKLAVLGSAYVLLGRG